MDEFLNYLRADDDYLAVKLLDYLGVGKPRTTTHLQMPRQKEIVQVMGHAHTARRPMQRSLETSARRLSIDVGSAGFFKILPVNSNFRSW